LKRVAGSIGFKGEQFGATNEGLMADDRRPRTELALATLKTSAKEFSARMSSANIQELYGITDGKAVGTYVEHSFHEFLADRFEYLRGSSAKGIDFPGLGVDVKVTSIKQPQSSCPFASAEQKVYGLGYHLLVFVYQKRDDGRRRAARLNIVHSLFVTKDRTADYQTTSRILKLLENNGNVDDIDAELDERNLPLEDVGRRLLAEKILREPPEIGYLTVSNALQWRLQYERAIQLADTVTGVENLLRS